MRSLVIALLILGLILIITIPTYFLYKKFHNPTTEDAMAGQLAHWIKSTSNPASPAQVISHLQRGCDPGATKLDVKAVRHKPATAELYKLINHWHDVGLCEKTREWEPLYNKAVHTMKMASR